MTPQAARLKIIIRRLPPGLSREEFISTLGPEWEVGQGRVDWAAFKPGKISKDLSKPSRPTRAYLHLTDQLYISNLAEAVRKCTFEDAQTTLYNQCLIGPPTIEYAPFGYIPSERIRVDARAGTIDQDPDFMAFLEGLANPIKEQTSEPPVETITKQEKTTITPLVQYLIEKKAIKNKEAAAKSSKKQDTHSSRGKNVKDTNVSPDEIKKRRDSKAERLSNKAAKEAVKILNRDIAPKTSPASSRSIASPLSDVISSKPVVEKMTPARQRGVAMAAHIRMLHRDLGITSAKANRQVKRETTEALKVDKVATNQKITSTKETESAHTQNLIIPTAPRGKLNARNNRRTRGKGHSNEPDCGNPTSTISRPPTPVVLLKKAEASRNLNSANYTDPVTPPTKPRRAGPSKKSQLIAPSEEGVVQAFIKHANPSQGITEPLLKEAMEMFGEVTMVEVDRRKGFAYVNFLDPEGLKKAIAASPIHVAQGAIQVMPRKAPVSHQEKKATQQLPPHLPSRSGRGGRGGNIGGRSGRNRSKSGTNNAQNANMDFGKRPAYSATELPVK
ncbi:putative nonsense-mediated mrna decay protein [Erysiphe neolycopersici]|uniref:Putative nonsense-mediated mrna decay protein n=1 Tax=Erysiphe neolycopersici TaxID=212602 RepID=A0A420HTM1_9PEZI|nr:putative nonsense-mediated mrna decay protein [Erysiphe neolycopersici]